MNGGAEAPMLGGACTYRKSPTLSLLRSGVSDVSGESVMMYTE